MSSDLISGEDPDHINVMSGDGNAARMTSALPPGGADDQDRPDFREGPDFPGFRNPEHSGDPDSPDYDEPFVPNLRIVLVEPMYKGNIGSVARVMKNFGLTDLALVNPCALGIEAQAMASHAKDVLENARICRTVEEAVEGCDVIIGTTGARAFKKCDHIRTPMLLPTEIRRQLEIFGKETKTAVLFGREDHGFSNEELAACTMITTIPTHHIYPVMNISHAVGVMAYELTGAREAGSYKAATLDEFENLCRHVREVLDDADYNEKKKEHAVLMFRRIFGRAYLTSCEVSTLRGILRNLQHPIRKGKGEDVSKPRSHAPDIFEKEETFSFDADENEGPDDDGTDGLFSGFAD